MAATLDQSPTEEFDPRAAIDQAAIDYAALKSARAAREQEVAGPRGLFARLIDKVSQTPTEETLEKAEETFNKTRRNFHIKIDPYVFERVRAAMDAKGDAPARDTFDRLWEARYAAFDARNAAQAGTRALEKIGKAAKEYHGAADSEKLDALVSSPGFSALSAVDRWAAGIALGIADTALANFRAKLTPALASGVSTKPLSDANTFEGLDTALDFGFGGPIDVLSFWNAAKLNDTAKSMSSYQKSIEPIVEHCTNVARLAQEQETELNDEFNAKHRHYLDDVLQELGVNRARAVSDTLHLIPENLPTPRPVNDMASRIGNRRLLEQPTPPVYQNRSNGPG